MQLFDIFNSEVSCYVYKEPFRYVIFNDLFSDEFVESIKNEFNDVLSRGLHEEHGDHFGKFEHYSAHGYTISPKDESLYSLSTSLEFKKFINGFFQKKLTNNVMASLHHHAKVNSGNGYVHNDYNLCSFQINDGLGIINQDGSVKYFGKNSENIAVRSIALIYYFNNDPYEEGDGGGTGLYLPDNFENPVKVIEPYENRLFAFDITPYSYHAFQNNVKHLRNSYIMWYHSPLDWTEKKYQEEPFYKQN